MNNEFVNSNVENKEKASELLSLRTTKTKKEFIENYKVQHGFKTADELIDKIIKLMSNEKVDATEKRFNLDEDIKIINKSIENVKGIIDGISAKVNSEIDDTIRKTNDKLEQKDAVLLEAESMIKNMKSAAEQQFESFKKENDELAKELEDSKRELVAAKTNILSLEEENKDKDVLIDRLHIEKSKLDAQITDCVESRKEMQIRINSLLDLEEKNKELKDALEEMQESNRNFKTEIAIRDNTLCSREDVINKLNKNITSLETAIKEKESMISNINEEKSKLNVTIASLNNQINTLTDSKNVLASNLEVIKSDLDRKEQELSTLNEECRNEVANITIEFKEKLLEAKFEAKNEAEKKYEDKIEKLKDAIFKLRAENAALMKKNK